MSGSKYTGLLCYETCVRMYTPWLLNSVSNVCYECGFFQDFLEELKLVVRGSLFQVASLQDCFLQQSEPLAATSTGVSSCTVCAPSLKTSPRPLDGLGPITETWAVSTAALQGVSSEIMFLCQSPGQEIFPLHLYFCNSSELELIS